MKYLGNEAAHIVSHRESRTREEQPQIGVRCGNLNNPTPISDLSLINNGLRGVENHNIGCTEINH